LLGSLSKKRELNTDTHSDHGLTVMYRLNHGLTLMYTSNWTWAGNPGPLFLSVSLVYLNCQEPLVHSHRSTPSFRRRPESSVMVVLRYSFSGYQFSVISSPFPLNHLTALPLLFLSLFSTLDRRLWAGFMPFPLLLTP